MNKKSIISLSLITAFALSNALCMAETTIYTDGIGRMHFLGKDPATNIPAKKNYSNPAEQDLTRRLYENSTGEINNVDYKLKDYDNTFGFGKMDTQTMWKNKFVTDVDAVATDKPAEESKPVAESKTTKATMTFEKGAADASRTSAYGATNIYDTKNKVEAIKDKSVKKTHWWNKSK